MRMRHRFDDAIANHNGPIHPARIVHEIAKTLIQTRSSSPTAAKLPTGCAMRGRRAIRDIPHPWLPRMPGDRLAVRTGSQGGASRQAGFLHRRRRIGGTQFLGVPYRREEQPAYHRRSQQRPAMGDVETRAGTDVGQGPQHVATELGMVHYETRGEGLGAQGEFVERAEDIAPAMKRALASGRPPA